MGDREAGAFGGLGSSGRGGRSRSDTLSWRKEVEFRGAGTSKKGEEEVTSP
jgi:hypothetical protein